MNQQLMRLLSTHTLVYYGVLSNYNIKMSKILYHGFPPKNGEIALWPSTNGAIPYFLILPGSELSITEIAGYTYSILIKPIPD